MAKKITKSDQKTKVKDREQRQIKASFIIVSITIIFLGTFFFGLYYLNQAARNDASTMNENVSANEIVETVTPSPNQLVVVHTGKTVHANKFDVSVELVNHQWIDGTNVDSTIRITSADGQSTEIRFVKIGESVSEGAFTYRMANATEGAAQIVVQKK